MTVKEKRESQTASPGSFLTGWARQGVQSFVAAQKILMDLASQENALLIGIARERLSKPGFRPDMTLAGLAEKGVENLASAGKILLDLAAGETELAVDGLKEGLRLPLAAGTMAEVVRHRVDTLIELQKSLLDAATEQAHAAAESYRAGERVRAAANVAELARRGIEGFVESEKKFLDLAAQQVSAATKGDKRTHKPPRERMEVLSKVAREGAEKYIDTQKKLLDLAIEQLEETAKNGREHKDTTHKAIAPLWGELTEKSVRNFVNAEKSLLELATKPINRQGREEGRKVSRSGHKTHRAAKKQTAEAREPVAGLA
jgi:hypothetical protein